MNMREVLFRRRTKLLLKNTLFNLEEFDIESVQQNNIKYVATTIKNVESLGYTLDNDLIKFLLLQDSTELIYICQDLVETIKSVLGANVEYNPMYPNFPVQVMEASEAELFINAIVHYWSFGTILPEYEKEEREALTDINKYTVIYAGTQDDVTEVMSNLMKANVSLSVADKTDLILFFNTYEEEVISKAIPDKIPFKENVVLIADLLVKTKENLDANQCYNLLKNMFDTATDVLRFAVQLSGGDTSLSGKIMFKNFSRKESKLLLKLLEHCKGNIEEDMRRYRTLWIKFGEKTHPNRRQYLKKVVKAFAKLRDKESAIKTFNTTKEQLIREEKFEELVVYLKKRSGEMARSLNHLLRTVEDKNLVINSFKEVADSVSTSVLLQVKNHFENLNTNKDNKRLFILKGGSGKSFVKDEDRVDIEEKWCKAIVRVCDNALVANYKTKDFLGNVYTEGILNQFAIPSAQRTASKALKTIPRGSRIKFNGNKEILRLFIYWKESVDVDLSASALDENWNCKDYVSYYGLRSYGLTHSGDITNGYNGACEFVDIELSKMREKGIRYIIPSVHSYSCVKYCDMNQCFAGFMLRDNNSGEIFEPTTVQQKYDLTGDSIGNVMMIVDIVENEMIWIDMNTPCQPSFMPNNLDTNMATTNLLCKEMTKPRTVTMKQLVDLHTQARGLECDTVEEADIVFGVKREDYDLKENQVFVSVFDTDKFMELI